MVRASAPTVSHGRQDASELLPMSAPRKSCTLRFWLDESTICLEKTSIYDTKQLRQRVTSHVTLMQGPNSNPSSLAQRLEHTGEVPNSNV